MHKTTLLTVSVILTLFLIFSCNSKNTGEYNGKYSHQTTDPHTLKMEELHMANERLYNALNAMFTGDLEPMNDVWSHSEDITDMGPFGGRLTGWDEVSKEFKKEAAMKFGGKIACNDLHIFTGSDMGYTICIEEGENMSTDGKKVTVSHRATNIFHLENGIWKLVHHQTDISPQLEAAFDEETK